MFPMPSIWVLEQERQKSQITGKDIFNTEFLGSRMNNTYHDSNMWGQHLWVHDEEDDLDET